MRIAGMRDDIAFVGVALAVAIGADDGVFRKAPVFDRLNRSIAPASPRGLQLRASCIDIQEGLAIGKDVKVIA